MTDAEENTTAPSWVLIGCGYTATRLAIRLQATGTTVHYTRRGQAGLDGVRHILGEDAEGHLLDLSTCDVVPSWLPRNAIVVHSAPPDSNDPGGNEKRLVAIAHAARCHRVLYLSSTGVYPAVAASSAASPPGWIDETTAPSPPGLRGRNRLAAETSLLAAARDVGADAASLRIAGIYGPGRGVAPRMKNGTYRIVGPGDTYVSRIHVEDLISAIVATGTAAVLRSRIYNIADQEPSTSVDHATTVAAALAIPFPPHVTPSDVPPEAAAMAGANRRICSRRLRDELQLHWKYPTVSVASLTQ